MDNDLTVFVTWMCLEFYTHPAMTFCPALVTLSRNSIGEREKRTGLTAMLKESVQIEFMFLIKHRLKSFAANVTIGATIDGVADFHVVSRHALRNCPGSPANSEEPPDDFLSGTDFGERSITSRIKIYTQRPFGECSLAARPECQVSDIACSSLRGIGATAEFRVRLDSRASKIKVGEQSSTEISASSHGYSAAHVPNVQFAW